MLIIENKNGREKRPPSLSCLEVQEALAGNQEGPARAGAAGQLQHPGSVQSFVLGCPWILSIVTSPSFLGFLQCSGQTWRGGREPEEVGGDAAQDSVWLGRKEAFVCLRLPFANVFASNISHYK